MRKMDMAIEIQSTLLDMAHILDKARAIKHVQTVCASDLMLLPYKDILAGFNWILKIKNLEYRAANKARKLVRETAWEYYSHFPEDFKDHAQVVIWNKAAAKLRKAVRSGRRPYIFKKGTVDAKCNKIKKTAEKNS